MLHIFPEFTQSDGLVLVALVIITLVLGPKLRKVFRFVQTPFFQSRHPLRDCPSVGLAQYKSEDDLRKEFGWSDRAWGIAKCQGPYAPLYPDRKAYEHGKAKVPKGYELTQVNIVSTRRGCVTTQAEITSVS